MKASKIAGAGCFQNLLYEPLANFPQLQNIEAPTMQSTQLQENGVTPATVAQSTQLQGNVVVPYYYTTSASPNNQNVPVSPVAFMLPVEQSSQSTALCHPRLKWKKKMMLYRNY